MTRIAAWLRALAAWLDPQPDPLASRSGHVLAPADLSDLPAVSSATSGEYLPRKGDWVGAWIPGDRGDEQGHGEGGAFVRARGPGGYL